MLTGTSVVDLPSTTFCSAYFGLGSSLAHEPSWMCAGCDTPFGAPFQADLHLGLVARRRELGGAGSPGVVLLRELDGDGLGAVRLLLLRLGLVLRERQPAHGEAGNECCGQG
jgi:hypothetical protein